MIRALGSRVLMTCCIGLASCSAIGPDYQRPSQQLPVEFKEAGPWREAIPGDLLARGAWWELFGDPVLSSLEAQALRDSPRLLVAAARVEQTRAVAGIAESAFYPYVSIEPDAGRYGVSGNRLDQPSKLPGNRDYDSNRFRVPLYASYEIDVWGKVRRLSESARAQAEGAFAAYHTVLLTLEGEVAQTYFGLRVADEERRSLQSGIDLRKRARDLVAARKKGGLASELDLARVETELALAEADLQAVNRRRLELEHSLAVLVGRTPESFTLPQESVALKPPVIPVGLPSDLLQRRPDVAEAERVLIARNAEIGLAQAAYFPSIRLTGALGFESNDLSTLLDKESTIWGLAVGLVQPIFDGGRIRGNVERAKASYAENLAAYRQRLLVAFQEVDSALAGLRVLSEQADAQARAVANADKAVGLASARYKAGLVIVLEVIDAQRTSLQAQRQSAQILNQQLLTSVALIKALGGGWEGLPVPAADKQAQTGRPRS